MIIVVDVDYRGTIVNTVALVFENITDKSASSIYTKIIENIVEYQPYLKK